jgi:hypothetical protein
MRLIPGILLFALLAGVAGCSDNNTVTTPPTTPTTPGASTTETFSGTLGVNGATTFSFTAGAAGTVTATLTSLAPDPTAVIGVAIGGWNGSSCTISIANDAATQSSVVTGVASAAVSLCARVYDAGKMTAGQSFNYTITVTHP